MGKMNLSYVGEIGIIEKPRMLFVQYLIAGESKAQSK